MPRQALPRVQVVGAGSSGAGRMAAALVAALRGAGYDTPEPAPRGATGAGAGIVLLAVPDAAIPQAAALIEPGRLVGHLSGATTLEALRPHEAFGLHPLTSVAAAGEPLAGESRESGEGARTAAGSALRGSHAAVVGSSERALATAERLARDLGMTPFTVADRDRAAYHAAASIAANFLIAVEGFAERLAATAGVPRRALVPLVESALRNWAELGAPIALTGPVARGDEETVARQREAVASRSPERLALFDALLAATRDLADESRAVSAEQDRVR
ncbi:DUF2520 domain-containing protein [Leucobacter weissii]|uniref:DUF2520 domain-containing protein n=1 Tax=Leucobacter weissii TaxID=1983706 RepID=A0A939S9X5_9MICO|nr:DUF2520 domain-containing protein [Leucobacter weissii]MBO1901362.1 DUF2520 domain-containing protein [Leucobacter weissii]